MTTKTKRAPKREKPVKETREEALARLLEVALAMCDGDYGDPEEDRLTWRQQQAAGLARRDRAKGPSMSVQEAFSGECLYWLCCAERGSVANVATKPSARLGSNISGLSGGAS